MLPLRARVDLGAMAMKGYSTFPKAPALPELHHQTVYCHFQDTHSRGEGVLPLCRETVGVFYNPNKMDQEETQTNGPRGKKINDYAQGVTYEDH